MELQSKLLSQENKSVNPVLQMNFNLVLLVVERATFIIEQKDKNNPVRDALGKDTSIIVQLVEDKVQLLKQEHKQLKFQKTPIIKLF